MKIATSAIEQALAMTQTLATARAHHQAGRLLEAEGLYRQVLARQPNHAEALYLLGVLANQVGRADGAVELIGRAVQLKPDFPEAHNNLGIALSNLGQLDEAIAAFRQAIQLKPDFPEAYNNLGIALKNQEHFDEALVAYHQAIQLKPDFVESHSNLASALRNRGHLYEALAAYERAMALKPDNPEFASSRLFLLHSHPGYGPQSLYEEHRRWNQQYAAPLKRHIQTHRNDRSPERRLKIGYVSPDLRSHPVGHFLLPLLECHDHAQVQVFCYADVYSPDAMTERLRAHADVWHSIVGLSDEQVASLIRIDSIDILVDLTLHTAHNRLLVFARKPAPVQVTYLAYPSTSGLDTMDYRLTDPYLDPPGSETDSIYSERSIRLPQTYWCYQTPDLAPEVGPLPALAGEGVTFGCLNDFNKVREGTLSVWCALLRSVPQSRLLLHAGEGSHRQRVADLLKQEGVNPERLSFVGRVPLGEYYGTYGRIDIGLDPFPFAGGTTTCDALWMGVPVVSLAGETAVSRGGLSILSNVGLGELVAGTAEEYVGIAAELAGDWARLACLRAGLRSRMASSPLMDGPGFARSVEAAYRQMWYNWCEELPR